MLPISQLSDTSTTRLRQELSGVQTAGTRSRPKPTRSRQSARNCKHGVNSPDRQTQAQVELSDLTFHYHSAHKVGLGYEA